MPIYAYACGTCGLKQDVMQKMSDAQLTVCPECGKETFTKQLTAAGFQLKGNGYYVTDFKGGNKKPAAEKSDAGKSETSSEAKPAAAPAPAVSPSAPSATTGAV